MERSYQCFQSIPDAHIGFGASDGPGQECSKTVHIINVTVSPLSGPYGKPYGEPMDIALALTVPQMAAIVKHFFFFILSEENVFARFLSRLLRKRWAVMTDSTSKHPCFEEEYKAMQYVNLP